MQPGARCHKKTGLVLQTGHLCDAGGLRTAGAGAFFAGRRGGELPVALPGPPGVGVEKQIELAESVRVVLAPSAHIANPGRKVGHGD